MCTRPSRLLYSSKYPLKNLLKSLRFFVERFCKKPIAHAYRVHSKKEEEGVYLLISKHFNSKNSSSGSFGARINESPPYSHSHFADHLGSDNTEKNDKSNHWQLCNLHYHFCNSFDTSWTRFYSNFRNRDMKREDEAIDTRFIFCF